MQSLITNKKIIEDIKEVIVSNRQKIAYEVNNTMLLAYWNVGKIIVENEQNGNIKIFHPKATDIVCKLNWSHCGELLSIENRVEKEVS